MRLKLNLQYTTQIGENVCVNVCQHDGTITQYSMQPENNNFWVAEIDIKKSCCGYVDYFYSIQRQTSEIRREWHAISHRLETVGNDEANYISNDIWYDMPDDSYLYSSAYTDCIHRRDREMSPKSDYAQTLRIKVRAPQLRQGEKLYLVGDGEQLGEWHSERSLPMYEHAQCEWVATIDATQFKAGDVITFKFIIRKDDGDPAIIWEEGENRTLLIPTSNANEVHVYEVHRAWFPIYDEKYAGTAVPVFSLRSEGSFGVGDFGDLKLMVDWVSKTYQRVLQVLPINDTTLTHTWTDSYPYSCVSIYALHPMYTDLRQLPALKDAKKADEFETLRNELNALSQIDYERVTKAKNEYLRLLFNQESKVIFGSDEYKQWFSEEQEWLVPYAQYSIFRDKFGTPDYTKWPDHNTWDEADRKTLTNPRTKAYKEVAFFYFEQYILAQQMKGAHEYARTKNVVLKGDIPIGVNRYGCDAWMEPRYFNLNGQAGAPPDSFSVNGQNWGFPTYNWDEMLKDDCAWWVRRFSNMAKYFDAYRIDHVLGFFRIWEIPVHAVHGLLGQFQPSLGLTRQEIEQNYGLYLNDETMFEPLITDWILDRWFGDKANYVREAFLVHWHDDRYGMKDEFKTQRQVEKFFIDCGRKDENGKLCEEDENLRDTLYALISNVLFLHDHKDPNRCHPRISAQLAPCYEALWDADKEKFNVLYNDYFYRRNNHFWYIEAMKKLPKLVNATRMLVCAEDLGMVPDCVAWVMNELRILSLEIQSMPKDPKVKFGILPNNPYRSVCTISSHDTATMRMWWDEDYDQIQQYYNESLGRGDAAPHPMPGWLAQDIIFRHLSCPSMLCILTLQDWLATDETVRLADAGAERINIPANPKHYWRYRMHINLEQLLASDDLNHRLQSMIRAANR